MCASKYYQYFGERFIPSQETETIRKRDIEVIKSFLPLSEVKWILDIGCGGIIPALLAKEGYNIVGIDANNEFIQKGREKVKNIGIEDKVTLIYGDARNLEKYLNEKYEKKFDAVLMWEDVLPHFSIQEFNFILQSTAKYVKDKSRLLMSYVDIYKIMIEPGYKNRIIKKLNDTISSISVHKGYKENEGAFVRRHIICEGENILDEFDLKVYIWSPSLVNFIADINGYELAKRSKVKFPFNSYESIIDLYKRVNYE